MNKPIMAKATAVWLVDNTTLSFKQIADFCGLHELEVQGIADGDVAAGVKGFDPIANNQLDQIEIDRAEKDPMYKHEAQVQPGRHRRGKAARAALHALVQASGPAGGDPLAREVPPRTVGRRRSRSSSARRSPRSSRSANARTGTSRTSSRSTRWRSASASSPSLTPPCSARRRRRRATAA
jgi:hypothetical protein